MADKIDQIVVKNSSGNDVSYDIDLPVDATPSIASITTSGNATIGGSISEGGTSLSNKYLGVKPDGTNALIDSSTSKINTFYIPDYLLGQLIYGGVVNAGTAVATLSAGAKAKLGTTATTITLTNNTASITGYGDNEGIYYVVSTGGTFAGINFSIGDWLISTGSAWNKVDNTDEVTSVNGQTGAVNLYASNIEISSTDSTTIGASLGSKVSSSTVSNVTYETWYFTVVGESQPVPKKVVLSTDTN